MPTSPTRLPSGRRDWIALGLLLALAAGLRLAHRDWDNWLGAHPDERYVVLVAGDLRGLNPYQTGDPAVARTFPYGHLPVYLLAGAAGLFREAGRDPFEHLLAVGRALSALADTATVGLTYVLGRRLAGRAVALWAAAAYALSPLPVQLAHFYAVDALLGVLVLATLLGAVWRAQGGPRQAGWLAALAAGLAVGSKASAVLLVLPLVVGEWFYIFHRGGAEGAQRATEKTTKISAALYGPPRLRGELLPRTLILFLITLTAFALTNPFALLQPRLFLTDLSTQSAMLSGTGDFPYTRQYAGTWPYVYDLEQLARWGLGPPLALLALAGLGYALWRMARRQALPAEWVLLAWVIPYGLITGAFYAKFTRYLLPLTPLLCLYAALALAALGRRAAPLAAALGGVALLVAGGHALALVAMYAEPHPWWRASAWIYQHVPPGAELAVELWDDPLPFPITLAGQALESDRYRFVPLDLFAPDAPDKLAGLAAGLAESDYVVLASQRLYGTLPRLAHQGDARYAATACYYRRLLGGGLGYRLAYAGTRFPRLGPLVLVDRAFAPAGLAEPAGLPPVAGWAVDVGRVDESYNVYDHPQVLVFENVERWNAERVRAALMDEAGRCG